MRCVCIGLLIKVENILKFPINWQIIMKKPRLIIRLGNKFSYFSVCWHHIGCCCFDRPLLLGIRKNIYFSFDVLLLHTRTSISLFRCICISIICCDVILHRINTKKWIKIVNQIHIKKSLWNIFIEKEKKPNTHFHHRSIF